MSTKLCRYKAVLSIAEWEILWRIITKLHSYLPTEEPTRSAAPLFGMDPVPDGNMGAKIIEGVSVDVKLCVGTFSTFQSLMFQCDVCSSIPSLVLRIIDPTAIKKNSLC